MRTFRLLCDVVIGFFLFAYGLHLATTGYPDFWAAIKRQTHMPDRIGTVDFDTAVDSVGAFLLQLLIVVFVVRFVYRVLRRNRDRIADAVDVATEGMATAGSALQLKMSPAVREQQIARGRADLDDLTGLAPSVAELTNEDEREAALEQYTKAGTGLGESPRWALFATLADASSTFSAHVTIATWGQPVRAELVSRLAQPLGATFVPDLDDAPLVTRGIFIWDVEPTPYDRTRMRLWLYALNLVMCESAGPVADRLHDDLAAECRLASYQGYMVSAGLDAEAIEVATIAECQSILRADLIASTPDAEVAA